MSSGLNWKESYYNYPYYGSNIKDLVTNLKVGGL